MSLSQGTLLVLVLLLACSSCQQDDERPEPLHTPAQTLDLRPDVMAAHEDVKSDVHLTPHKHENVCLQERTVLVKSDFTGDEVEDVFAVDGLGGLSSGFFCDGVSGQELSLEPEHALILSRAGISIEAHVADVHPGDKQKEVIVFTGGGGTLGEIYNVDIFRFDTKTGRMKLIFSEMISAFDWDDNHGERLVSLKHISVLEHLDEPFDEITVSEGRFLGKAKAYSRNIGKSPTGGSERFVFDLAKNAFVSADK